MAQPNGGDTITAILHTAEVPTPSSSSTSPVPPRDTTITRASTTASNNRSSASAPRPLFLSGRMRHRAAEKANNDADTPSSEVRRRVGFEEEKSGDSTLSGTGVIDPSSTTKDKKRLSTTVELSHIDKHDRPLEEIKKDLEETVSKVQAGIEHEIDHIEEHAEEHYRSWTDRMHGHRPDRHLFPYRSVKENLRAARTFLRRFFFLILIIPAFVVPYVLKIQAEHKEEHSATPPPGHGANGTNGITTESMLMWASAAAAGGGEASGGGGGGEAEPLLSIGANVVIFILNMLVMMHLGKAAGVALEELEPRFGASVVSIFDAMTSSSVELAVALFALRHGLISVVQAAMLGAMLNNLLLMLGIAIIYGGYYHEHQYLTKETTQTSVNILMLTSIAYIIPVAMDATLRNLYSANFPVVTDPHQKEAQNALLQKLVDKDILKVSHGMAIVLLMVYGACLLYQYHSRTFMVTPEAKHEGPRSVEKRYTHFWFAGVAYVCCMAAQIYAAKLLVHAIESLGHQLNLNDSFVGFILLPIVLIADLQEEVVAIRESRANHLDKAMSLMVGSCMQIALLVTPILVLIGWGIGQPMTFRFSILEAIVLVGSVMIVNYLIADRETNWFEGVILLAIFLLCAIAFWYDESHPPEGISLDDIADAGSNALKLLT